MIAVSKQSASTSWQCNSSGNHHLPATYRDKGMKHSTVVENPYRPAGSPGERPKNPIPPLLEALQDSMYNHSICSGPFFVNQGYLLSFGATLFTWFTFFAPKTPPKKRSCFQPFFCFKTVPSGQKGTKMVPLLQQRVLIGQMVPLGLLFFMKSKHDNMITWKHKKSAPLRKGHKVSTSF